LYVLIGITFTTHVKKAQNKQKLVKIHKMNVIFVILRKNDLKNAFNTKNAKKYKIKVTYSKLLYHETNLVFG